MWSLSRDDVSFFTGAAALDSLARGERTVGGATLEMESDGRISAGAAAWWPPPRSAAAGAAGGLAWRVRLLGRQSCNGLAQELPVEHVLLREVSLPHPRGAPRPDGIRAKRTCRTRQKQWGVQTAAPPAAPARAYLGARATYCMSVLVPTISGYLEMAVVASWPQ